MDNSNHGKRKIYIKSSKATQRSVLLVVASTSFVTQLVNGP